MPELSQLISDRAAELRLAWREAAQADDLAVMHITGQGVKTLRQIAEWLSTRSESRLQEIVGSPPWTNNEGGADSPTTLLTSLAATLDSEFGSEFEDEIQQMVSAMGVAIDAVRRERVRELEQRAATDFLTGAMSRSAVLHRLEEEVARTRRHGRPLSVVFFDVDSLKKTNDEQGHVAGDNLLRALAMTVQRGSRTSDAFGRLGGDEFLLVLPETDLDGARVLANRLEQSLRAGDTGVSMGIAGTPDTDATPDSLIKAADAAMRAAKATKR